MGADARPDRRWLARGAVLATLLLGMALAGCGAAYQFKGAAYPEGKVAADFELTSAAGQPFRLSEQKGKVVLLFFGYTSCPDICPTTLAEARQVLDGLGKDAGQVEYAFITVDPERDTPEKIAAYTATFHPAIVGLTGDPAQLAALREAYGVIAERQEQPNSATGYVVNHTARVFLVDPQGNLRLSYAFGTPPADILDDVRHLLQS